MIRVICVAMVSLVFSASAFPSEGGEAGNLPDEAIIAERGGSTVSVGDVRTKLRSGLSPEGRRGFFTDGQKVAALVDELLTARQMAEYAKQTGLAEAEDIQAEIRLFTEDLLARRLLSDHMAALEEPDYEVLARERYLTRKQDYAVPASRDVRHVLVLVNEEKTIDQAKAIAEEAYAALVDGVEFGEVFNKYSDDPNVQLEGWVRGVDGKNFDPAFTEAAFGLKKPGDISQPVRSVYGYHVIRFESETAGHTPTYDEVKENIVSTIRAEFRLAARHAYVDRFMSLPLNLNDETMQKLPTAEP